MNAKQLTAAETIVMKCIWDADHEMSLAEIVKNANEGYGLSLIHISEPTRPY